MSNDIENDDDDDCEDIFGVLRDDVTRAHARAKKSTYLEYKQDAADNLYPLLAAILEATDARLAAVEGALAGLIEDEDIIHEPLAKAIFGLTSIGDALCAALGDLAIDDVAKQRAKELIEAWQVAVIVVRRDVTDALVDTGEDVDSEDAKVDGEGD